MSGFEQAHANIDAEVTSHVSEGTAAPESEAVEQTQETSEGTQEAAIQAILDLDGATKFKFQGKEWTPEELHKSILRNQDYTKKTQEIASERRYMSNLQHDLASVKRDPRLADEFRKIYPESYHGYLDVVLEQAAHAENQGTQNQQGQTSAQTTAEQKRLEALEKKFGDYEQRISTAEKRAHDAEVSKHEKHLGQLFDRLGTKYEFGIEEAVLTKAEALIANGYEMNDAAWERLWKASHEQIQAKADKRQKAIVAEQLKKNQSGGDIGAGGGTPGQAAKRMTMEEATEAAIAQLKRQG